MPRGLAGWFRDSSMFKIFRTIKQLLWFSGERVGDYAELFQLELVLFKQSLVRAMVGCVLLGMCVVLCLGFVSVALLVTFWDTPNRIPVAWGLAGGWFVLAALSGWFTYSLHDVSASFDEFGDAIRRDLRAVKGEA
jgi:hypothetical protein